MLQQRLHAGAKGECVDVVYVYTYEPNTNTGKLFYMYKLGMRTPTGSHV